MKILEFWLTRLQWNLEWVLKRKDVSTYISKSLRNVSSNGSVKRYLTLNPQYLAFNQGNTHALMDHDSNLDLP